MPCEFHEKRPFFFDNLGPGCQFKGETKFFEFAYKFWCGFHLPMEDDVGNKSEKADWKENKVTRFNAAVLAFIDEAREDEKTADLTGVAFPGNVSFTGFTKDKPFPRACFFKTAFSGEANFREAAFSGYANFIEAVFIGDAFFREAAFSGDANFFKAAFSGDANFFKAAFSGGAYFREAAFIGIADFSGGADEEAPSRRFRQADFADAVFEGRADFSNRRFLDTARFTRTIFHAAPEFHNAELHQDTDFTGATFKDTSEEHAARAYRTLKLAMGKVKARNEEAMFYAYEQKSLRRRDDTPRPVKALSWLYELTADYGRSFVRPLACLVVVTAVFWLCYVLVATTPGAAFDFAMTQLVRPFSVWIPLKAAFAGPPLWLKFLATVQSVISLGLLTLFILAIRRRFRLN